MRSKEGPRWWDAAEGGKAVSLAITHKSTEEKVKWYAALTSRGVLEEQQKQQDNKKTTAMEDMQKGRKPLEWRIWNGLGERKDSRCRVLWAGFGHRVEHVDVLAENWWLVKCSDLRGGYFSLVYSFFPGQPTGHHLARHLPTRVARSLFRFAPERLEFNGAPIRASLPRP